MNWFKKQLSASEALYGFCAWLTTRKAVTTMSCKHDSAPIAELVDAFCKENNLANPRDGWHKIKIQFPKEK